MRAMGPDVVNIGLPDLTMEQVEELAEACEEEISGFIMKRVPPKSIEQLYVNCALDLTERLDLDIEVDLVQKYDTGLDLSAILEEAVEHGGHWLEERLEEMRGV